MRANSKPWVAVKNGSYCRTGWPLLFRIVQPLPTQRGSTTGPPSTSGPGSASALRWISRPNPSEKATAYWIFVCASGITSATWVSRVREVTTAGCGSGACALRA